jgi:hypothetical protein
MIARLLVAGAFTVMHAGAQGHVIRAWFPDGAGVELYTEIAGSSQLTSVQGGGMIKNDRLSRIVQDNQNTIVFSYDLEAEKAAEPGAVTIRIKPASGGTPTVSAVREFRSVKRGQEVRLEILANPTTGERVYDVFRVAEGLNPSPRGLSVQVVKRPARGAIELVVNGQSLAIKSSWTAGKPARLYVPGQGAFYLSWEYLPKFRMAGYIEKNRLIFLMDSAYVEMTFGGNVLTTGERGPVWVYHEPGLARGPQSAELTTADLEAAHAKN